MFFSKLKAPFSAVFPALINREDLTREMHSLTDLTQEDVCLLVKNWDAAETTLTQTIAATPVQAKLIVEIVPEILAHVMQVATSDVSIHRDIAVVISDARRQDRNGDIQVPFQDLPLYATLNEMAQLLMIEPATFLDIAQSAGALDDVSSDGGTIRAATFAHNGGQLVVHRS